MSTISKCILTVTDKCGSYPSSKKLEFALDRAHYKNPQLVKMQKSIHHGVLSPKLYIYKTLPTPKFREHHRRGHRKVVGGRGWGHLKDGVFLFDKDAAPRKSQQHGCLDKTCTIRTPVYIPARMGEISKGLIPRSRATSNEWPLREGKTVFSRDKCQS